MRLENPLDIYGIKVPQIALGTPRPEKQLEQLLADKKRLVAARIKAVQEQETTKEQAKTAQLRAEIERTKAKQNALKHKELAVIAKQREVEEAEKQAEKELIEYEKSKDIAYVILLGAPGPTLKLRILSFHLDQQGQHAWSQYTGSTSACYKPHLYSVKVDEYHSVTT